MSPRIIKMARTLTLALAAGALTAGAASAQTIVTRAGSASKAQPRSVQPAPGAKQEIRQIELPEIQIPREGGLQAWPAAIFTVVGPTMPVSEGGGGWRSIGVTPVRAALVGAGAYDR